MQSTDKKPMNPYLAGAMAGILAVASIVIAGKYFGASTTFARIGGAVEGMILPERTAGLAYFQKYGFKIDWQLLFLIGITIGSFLSAKMSGAFKVQTVPDMWRNHFGPGRGPRILMAFVGGIVAAFGARMAGGCPSGHGISGLMQMSISGFIALACFFIGGIIVARMIYGRRPV